MIVCGRNISEGIFIFVLSVRKSLGLKNLLNMKKLCVLLANNFILWREINIMAYADKTKQQFMTKCYQKALSILKKLHEEEFVKILKKLLKGGKNADKIFLRRM